MTRARRREAMMHRFLCVLCMRRPAALGLRGVHVAAQRRCQDRRRGDAVSHQTRLRDERRAAPYGLVARSQTHTEAKPLHGVGARVRRARAPRVQRLARDVFGWSCLTPQGQGPRHRADGLVPSVGRGPARGSHIQARKTRRFPTCSRGSVTPSGSPQP